MLKVIFMSLILIASSQLNALDLSADPSYAGRSIYLYQDSLDKGYKDETAVVSMVLRNKGGYESIREFKMMTFEGDSVDKTLIVFKKPHDIKGTALLTYEYIESEDDQWLYLPSIKRVKRINSQNKSGSFVGSELSYEDISSTNVDKYKYKLIGEDVLDGVGCWIVERYPLDRNSGYSRHVTWVQQSNYQIRRIEYYDRSKALQKIAHMSDYRKYETSIWRAHKITVTNVQTDKRTTLSVNEYRFKNGLNEHIFRANELERIR